MNAMSSKPSVAAIRDAIEGTSYYVLRIVVPWPQAHPSVILVWTRSHYPETVENVYYGDKELVRESMLVAMNAFIETDFDLMKSIGVWVVSNTSTSSYTKIIGMRSKS